MQTLSTSKKQMWITVAIAVVVFLAGILIAILFRSQLDAVGSVIQGWMHPAPKAEAQLPKASDVSKTDEATKKDEHVLNIHWLNPNDGKYSKTDLPDVFLPLAISTIDPQMLVDSNGKPVSTAELKKSLSPFSMVVGTVDGGMYDKYALTVGQWTNEFEMGSSDVELYFLVGPQQQIVLLDKYGATSGFTGATQQKLSELLKPEAIAEFAKTQKIDSDAIITEFALPEVLTDAKGNTFSFFTMNLYGGNGPTPYTTAKASGYVDTINPVDQTKISLAVSAPYFTFLRPDGREVEYTYDIPWQGKGTNYVDQKGVTVNWNDGTVIDGNKYASTASSGCGSTSPDVLDQIPNMTAAGSVKDAAGKTYQIFQPVWTEQDTTIPNSAAANLYGNYTQRLAWDTTNKETASYAGFMKLHPVYFWQDPFGRWLRFTNENVQSAAECGKPVIYLYPTTTTSIDVSLAPKGGFTYTEPVYKNGWRVTASPDGTLVNRDDGKTYPYLFWEGRGAAYTSPQDFWVVKKNDVHRFLNETLAKIGLNKKETADFQEFWEPKMQSAPYYKIGFHGTNVMNEIAPMTLSKTPDSVLRILMDYTELQTPITQHPPKLSSTFIRNGFTVVEWGGVLR